MLATTKKDVQEEKNMKNMMKKTILSVVAATTLTLGTAGFASASTVKPELDLTTKVGTSTAIYKVSGAPNKTFNLVIYINGKKHVTSEFKTDNTGKFTLYANKSGMPKGEYDVYLVNDTLKLQLDNEHFSIK